MELDFDKEIDALIRREAAGRTITISERTAMHLDADEIAAFAEGAVPDGVRQTFVRHFADCDACRRTLSHSITMNAEGVTEASRGVAAPAIEAPAPWYRRLFVFPNLAYVMGGLVVLFAGFIGLSVLTSTYRSGGSEVSKTSPAEVPAAADKSSAMETAANTNSSASVTDTASNAANSAANIPYGSASIPSVNSSSNMALAKEAQEPADDLTSKDERPATVAAPPPARAPARSENFVLDGVTEKRPVPQGTPALAERDKTKAEEAKSAQENSTTQRTGPMPKLKGPTRNDRNERIVGMDAETERQRARKADVAGSSVNQSPSSVSRSVSGRTFVFRQGVWYDTVYQGQVTTNVRRNTEDYKKLDGGLRGLAGSFIGSVVVTIWNGRAYRIQ